MPTFFWKGIDQQGQMQKGMLEVSEEYQLQEMLLMQGVALLSYHKAQPVRRWFQFLLPQKRYDDEVILFFEHMAVLVNHGITVAQALEFFYVQTKNLIFKEALLRVMNKVKKGMSFAQALRDEQLLATAFVAQLVESGEETGNLGLVLERIALYLRNNQILKREIAKALMVPLVTVISAFALVFGIFVFIVPHFELIFTSLEKPLPAATLCIIKISHFLRSWWSILFFTLFFGLIIIFKWMVRFLPWVGGIKDRLCLSFLFRQWYLPSALVHFLQTLSLFLKAGISLKPALESASKTIQNSLLREQVLLVTQMVAQGKSLAASLRAAGTFFFPETLIGIIALGEQSGSLQKMIDHAVHFMQLDFKNRLHVMITLIQPCLLIVLGIIIALVMVAVYLPIFTMASLI